MWVRISLLKGGRGGFDVNLFNAFTIKIDIERIRQAESSEPFFSMLFLLFFGKLFLNGE